MTPVEELSELCGMFGLAFEIVPDILYESNTMSDTPRFVSPGYVKLLNSKKSGVKRKNVIVILSDNLHSTRLVGGEADFSVGDIWHLTDIRSNDRMAAETMEVLFRGCRLKISNNRTICIPKVSCLEELKLKLAITG